MVFALALCAGCSDDSETKQDGSTAKLDQSVIEDQGVTPDQSQLPDLTLPDIGGGTCEFEWQTAISPHKTVSTGAVATTDVGGGVKETTIDATAGGMGMAIHNPFVYVSFTDGSKVEIDDFAARTDTTWDLALRRTIIRVNGGDSGAGQGAVSIVKNKTLADVTAVPAANTFKTDDFLDDNCVIQYNEINNIKTAFGGDTGRWYDFDTQNMKVLPNDEVYVIKTATGSHIKLKITSYYNAANEGANFTVQWSPLP
jgi:hypothetical protein